jgi:hypothetical protein
MKAEGKYDQIVLQINAQFALAELLQTMDPPDSQQQLRILLQVK